MLRQVALFKNLGRTIGLMLRPRIRAYWPLHLHVGPGLWDFPENRLLPLHGSKSVDMYTNKLVWGITADWKEGLGLESMDILYSTGRDQNKQLLRQLQPTHEGL